MDSLEREQQRLVKMGLIAAPLPSRVRRGRKRKWASEADRQHALRERRKQVRGTYTPAEVALRKSQTRLSGYRKQAETKRNKRTEIGV